jgi:CheY-like chemotaxis protein
VKEVAESTAETPKKKKRILLVEDESTTRLFLLNQLKKAGLDVDTAATGDIAFKKVRDGHFDAVILDLMLSGLKGQDLIKEIRKKEDSAEMPIFVVTSAQRMDPWRKRGSKAGATRVFDKSAPIDGIVSEIVAHLIPKPKEVAPAKDKAEKSQGPKQTEISTQVPETLFPLPSRTTQPPKTAAQVTSPSTTFTPLPSGRDTSHTPRPATAAASTPPPPQPAVRESKTGFFRNPDPVPTHTELLQKAIKAGQAARGTPAPNAAAPAPAMSGDTPLHIPESAPVPTAPPAPPPVAQVHPAPEPPKEREKAGLAERIIAPFKIFSSRSDSSAVNELKEQLAEVTRNRDELLSLLRDHPIFGGPSETSVNVKPEALNEAKAAASRAEAAYQAELARSKQFEEELKRIREARDELNRKLAEEEKAAAESRRRSKELEERLTQSSTELGQVKAELQKHIAEHSKLEGDLRRQLNSTRESADVAKVAYQEQAARAVRSSEELATLRKAREELNERLTGEAQAAAESKRRTEAREQQLREKESEVERLKGEMVRRAAESGTVKNELNQKLTAAQTAAQHAEAACKEEAGRRTQFENELARLKQAREELNSKLAREEQAAAESRRRREEMERQLAAKASELDRVKAELDRHAQERKSLEMQLQEQIATANTATEQARRQFQEETTLFHRSKEEVDALRRARDELNSQLESEHHAAAESRRRTEGLESKLQASANELSHLRAELEKHVNERAALVTASSRQLNAAKAAAAKAEKAYQEQMKRAAKFERELAALREDRKAEQSSTAKSNRKIEELEKQAAAHAAELEKSRAQFEKQLSEHQRLESEHRSAREASLQVRTSESANDPASAEARFRESISALARVTAQLERERGERRRIEQRTAFLSSQLENLHEELRKHLEVEKETQQRLSEFEHQLRDRDEEVTKAVSEFQKEAAARQLAEAQLKAKGDMGNQLQERFNLLDEAKQVFNSAQGKLEARLEEAIGAHKQSEARLQRQIAERKGVETLLEETQRKLQEQAQQSASEITRLQSALELETIERRKQESQSLQSRYASLDASRLGRAFVNSFRTHLRPSADQLLQATRRLLELQLDDEHKQLVENALENALLLQTSMQDDARLPGESDTGEAAQAA